jgi:hypothetical protein
VHFDRDPSLKSLRHHQLEDRKGGKHAPGSFSVSPTMQYRAIYTRTDDGINVWYWLGTHAEYKKHTASQK